MECIQVPECGGCLRQWGTIKYLFWTVVLKEWIKKGLPTEIRTHKTYENGDFEAYLRDNYIVKYADIKRNIQEQCFTIIDARSEGRYNGTEQEPRKELKSGHIKGSINIPFYDVLSDGRFKSKQELKNIF